MDDYRTFDTFNTKVWGNKIGLCLNVDGIHAHSLKRFTSIGISNLTMCHRLLYVAYGTDKIV